MSETTTQTGGIGFCGLLTILFIALKLMGFIAWSWWWITAPIWLPFLAIIIILALVAVVTA